MHHGTSGRIPTYALKPFAEKILQLERLDFVVG